MAKKFGMGTLLVGALVVGAATQLNAKKRQTTVFTSPIILDCEKIEIKDRTKANQWLLSQASAYSKTIKSPEDISYITLLGDTLKKLNKGCYEKFGDQKLTQDQILQITYLFDWLKQSFITVYFGDPSKLEGEDLQVYDNFEKNISPERLVELQKFIGYKDEWANDLKNIIEIIEQNGRYPA